MFKSELIQAIAEKTKLTKSVVNDVIESMLAMIVETDKVTLKQFGTFEWKVRPARKGVNPQTGEKIDIPAATILKFKPSAGLKRSSTTTS
jgi:DNA-binding protein HU-beta